jgi:hypothetical protein
MLKDWTNAVDYDGKTFGNTMKYFSSYYSAYRGKPNHDNIRVQSSKKSV